MFFTINSQVNLHILQSPYQDSTLTEFSITFWRDRDTFSYLIIPYGVKIIQSVCSGGICCRIIYFMAESNHSAVTEFILLSLTGNPELQLIFFCVLLLIYLITALGNLGLIVLI